MDKLIDTTRRAVKQILFKGSGHLIHSGSMSADVREAGGAVRMEVNPKGINMIKLGAVDTYRQAQPQEKKLQKIEAMEMLMANDIAHSVAYVLSQHQRTSIVELKIKLLKQII